MCLCKVDGESLRNRRLRLLRVRNRFLVRLLLLAASEGRLESHLFAFISCLKKTLTPLRHPLRLSETECRFTDCDVRISRKKCALAES